MSITPTAAFEALARRHHAWEPTTDTIPFQRRARLLQALWRADRGLPIGSLRGKPRGALLTMPFAQESLAAFLTPTAQAAVRREVLDPLRARGKLFGRPRIFNNLLSSQPLCFNLFSELAADLPLATQVFAVLTHGRVGQVTVIDFEHSPGRRDPKYTGDNSAFDVFVSYEPTAGGRGFIGIEVKYHEGLRDKPAPHRTRYDEVAALMGVFKPARLADLHRRPLQQIWRDHLLSGVLKAVDGFDEGLFAFLYPEANTRCADAVAAYQSCLTDPSSVAPWTLEAVLVALRQYTAAPWVDAFVARYLDFARIDQALLDAAALPGD